MRNQKPGTFKEINSLITHLIDENLIEDSNLLSKIYIDLGMTAGNVFKLQMEKRLGKDIVPDPFPSFSPSY